MHTIFISTLEQILILFAFIAAGYILRRTALLPESAGKVLSVLETTLFLPAMIFKNLSGNIRAEKLSRHAATLGFGVLFLAAMLLSAFLLSFFFGKDKKHRNKYIYIFAFSNYAYFGYPILESIFGSEMLSDTVLFAIPFTIAIFTLGVYLLTGKTTDENGRKRLFPVKMLPVLAALALGITLGLAGVEIPQTVYTGVSSLAACMSPVSMILTGFVLASFRFSELFTSVKAYIVSAVRLILFPLFFGCIFLLAGLRGENLIIPIFISSMPVGMNVVVFTEANGESSKTNARICFISYLMSAVTVPLLFSLLEYFF